MFDQYGYQPAPTIAEAIEELRPIYREHFPRLSDEAITNSATRILVRDGICSNNGPSGIGGGGSLALWMAYVHNFQKKLQENGL
tara:strand:+ start:365 stop:616 length:252 start_codon:yes stop_codon:yes gene_type:complete